MPRTSQHPKETSFNLRIDPALKAAFTAATGSGAACRRSTSDEFASMREIAAEFDRDDFADEWKA